MPNSSIALLRGINVGGKIRLPMRELARIFSEAGCWDVVTYIQSGNVVFKADEALLPSLADRLTERLFLFSGMRIPVVLRTQAELAAAVRQNPFLDAGADPAALHVMFLANEPERSAIESLDPQRSPADSFRVIGREIYLHCPNGLARTKLTNDYFDGSLETISTGRNWRTTLKLLELAGG